MLFGSAGPFGNIRKIPDVTRLGAVMDEIGHEIPRRKAIKDFPGFDI